MPTLTGLVLVVLLCASPAWVHAALFLNCGASESAINADTTNTLFCDDFEDGSFISTNADGGGTGDPDNDGWRGVILNMPASGKWPDPSGQMWGRCGTLGVAGTDCVALAPFFCCNGDDESEAISGKHDFYPSAGTAVTDIYVRYYVKYLAPFSPIADSAGDQKEIMLQNDLGWQCCDLHSFFNQDVQADTPCTTVQLDSFQDSGNMLQNQGNVLCQVENHWYYKEMHVTLNTVGQADGVFEAWADDCGVNGLDCTGSGTLRASWTGRTFRNGSETIPLVWLNLYAHSPNTSGSMYVDQIVASRVRVGPMAIDGDATPPAVPSGVYITKHEGR